MPDHLALRFRGQRPAAMPAGLAVWNGYALPAPGRTFRRDELLTIAAANGHRLSPDLLHKWRNWRLIPAPAAGGPTGKGRGKGQTWPEGAGWRVAWISRWLTDALTYDAIRLAIWPWTRELELDRPEQLAESIGRFLVHDRDFHDITWAAQSPATQEELDPYFSLIGGDHRPGPVAGSLDIAGVMHSDPAFAEHKALFGRLSFDELLSTASTTDTEELVAFITAFRSQLPEATLTSIFWDSPLGLARIVVRELHRFRLLREGVI